MSSARPKSPHEASGRGPEWRFLPEELATEASLSANRVAASAAHAFADHLPRRSGGLGDDDVPLLQIAAMVRHARHQHDAALCSKGRLHRFPDRAGHKAYILLEQERRSHHLSQDERSLAEGTQNPRGCHPKANAHCSPSGDSKLSLGYR
eukprot:scaffold1004_cov269-Pinguiococcus_pyrenoidosus.AAC.17